MDNKGSERRKYLRVDSENVLKCERYAIPRSAEQSTGRTRNISAGGILFISDTAYEKGEVLRLELVLGNWEKYKAEFYKPDNVTGSKPLVVIGAVAHVRNAEQGRYEIGINFSGMDEGHRWALEKYIKALASAHKRV